MNLLEGLRHEWCLTLTEVAQAVGCTHQRVSQLEKSNRIPKVKPQLKLALERYFGYPYQQLFSRIKLVPVGEDPPQRAV